MEDKGGRGRGDAECCHSAGRVKRGGGGSLTDVLLLETRALSE